VDISTVEGQHIGVPYSGQSTSLGEPFGGGAGRHRRILAQLQRHFASQSGIDGSENLAEAPFGNSFDDSQGAPIERRCYREMWSGSSLENVRHGFQEFQSGESLGVVRMMAPFEGPIDSGAVGQRFGESF
jgi:hypothetical protein